MRPLSIAALAILFAGSAFGQTKPPTKTHHAPAWRSELVHRLVTMGHRNWVVVADSAYPEQSNPGILTIDTDMDHVQVLKEVLKEIAKCRHVRPVPYVDAELKYVPEARAHGVSQYRAELAKLLKGRNVTRMPHEQIIHMLDDSAKTFTIVILKTKETIPYTSVFINLNCAYWGDNDEKALRAAMKGGG